MDLRAGLDARERSTPLSSSPASLRLRPSASCGGPHGLSPARTRVVTGGPMATVRNVIGPPHIEQAQSSSPKGCFIRSDRDVQATRTRGAAFDSRRAASGVHVDRRAISSRQRAFNANTP